MKEIPVAVKITNRCDKMCAHCCESSVPEGQSMCFGLLQKVFTQISKTATNFGITGGEPVLYKWGNKNFLDVMDVCIRLNIKPTVMCGGAYDIDVYKKIFYNLKAPYKIPFTLSFNLFKPNPEKLFSTAYNMITLNNYVSDIFCVYTEDNKDETIKRLKAINTHNISVVRGNISPVGRAANLNYFKKYKIITRCNASIQKILYVNMEGDVSPCCEIDASNFPGWKFPKYTQSFCKTLALSNRYCQKCPVFNGVVPLPHQ